MPLRHAENHHPEEQFRVDVYLLPVQTQLGYIVDCSPNCDAVPEIDYRIACERAAV